MLEFIKRLFQEEKAQGLVEYGLIVFLVAILMITTLLVFKNQTVEIYEEISDKFNEGI